MEKEYERRNQVYLYIIFCQISVHVLKRWFCGKKAKTDFFNNNMICFQLNLTILKYVTNELILCHKLWFSYPYIFETKCCKPLILQTYIIWSNRTHSLKYQRSTTLESKDIEFRKSEFVAKTQLLYILYQTEIHAFSTFKLFTHFLPALALSLITFF